MRLRGGNLFEVYPWGSREERKPGAIRTFGFETRSVRFWRITVLLTYPALWLTDRGVHWTRDEHLAELRHARYVQLCDPKVSSHHGGDWYRVRTVDVSSKRSRDWRVRLDSDRPFRKYALVSSVVDFRLDSDPKSPSYFEAT